MDFTLTTYLKLLRSMLSQGFIFQTFEEFLNHPQTKSIILRHDVDRSPNNSLKIAQLEHKLGVKGSYYFRIVPESYDEKVITQIASLNHEIGYHYEDLTLASGDIDKAYVLFCKNLEKISNLFPVKTICMHGSPSSKFDNRDIWKKYDYHKLGILGEPYIDIDYDKVFYLTDTGRCWDGYKFSIRDKVPHHNKWFNGGLKFHSTDHISLAAINGTLPKQILITVHPQRWTDCLIPWIKELMLQNIKNEYKRYLVISGSVRNE